MAQSKSIKNALVTLLSGLQLAGETAFTEVKGYSAGEFDGYPSARVLPGDQTTEKAAIGQNDRTVSLIVRTHVMATDDGTDIDYLYDLTDLIIDSLDAADFDNELNIIDPTIQTHMLDATRGDWSMDDFGAGPVLLCDVNVDVKYSKNN